MQTPAIGARYRHYKNHKDYIILSIGRWQDDAMPVVVYQGQYDDPEFGSQPIWVRSLSDFMAMVDYNGILIPRFTLIW